MPSDSRSVERAPGLLPRRSLACWPLAVALALLAACRPSLPEPGAGGAVAAATPEAAAAGVRILEAGGNAVDAAVAVAFALTVSEPAGSGLMGQHVVLIHPSGGEPQVVLGTSYAPAATPGDATREELEGRQASTVPSTVKVLDHTWRHFGSGRLGWAELLAPAIELAIEGVELGPYRHSLLDLYAEDLRSDPAAAALFLEPDGSLPAPSARLRQPQVATTLARLAESGADDFYRGELARTIAGDMATHGGWITLEDLRQHPAPAVVPALRGSYRGWEVAAPPPPFGGWVVLQALNLLEQERPQSPDDEDWLPWMTEALRIAHSERRDAPERQVPGWGPEMEERLGKARAAQLWAARPASAAVQSPSASEATGETTHFSVVDGDGLAVAVTGSINFLYGARVANPATGLLYNNYMREFVLGDPDHPYALRPGAMPYSSMTPTTLSRGGEVHMALGGPGSERIISSLVQVVSHWVDHRMTIPEALLLPRLHVAPNDRLHLEAELAHRPGARVDLATGGLTLGERDPQPPPGALEPYFGGIHAVVREGRVWNGGADPRRDGAVSQARR